MDLKTLNKIRKGIAQGLKYERELQEKREQKMWRHVSEPFQLESVLNSLSKSELDRIRKNLELKGISGLNKGELIKELVIAIPCHLRRTLSRFDKERYVLFKNIVKHSGKLPLPRNVSVKKVEALMAWGVIFPIHLEGGKGLTVPIEIIEQFHALEGQELQQIIDRNTEWIQLTHGLLYYHGVMNTSLLVDRVSYLMKQEIDFLDFLHVFSSAYCVTLYVRLVENNKKTTWKVLTLLRIHAERTWESFLYELHRLPGRTSKGRQKSHHPPNEIELHDAGVAVVKQVGVSTSSMAKYKKQRK